MRAKALLRAREASGVMWACRARMFYLLLGALGAPLTSPTTGDMLVTLGLAALGMFFTAYLHKLTVEQRHLSFAGVGGVFFDLLVLYVLPLSWYEAVGADAVSRIFLVKGDLIFIAFLILVINTFAIRPLYPMIVTVGAIAQQVVLLVWASMDPRFAITSSPVEAHFGPKLHVAFYAWRLVALSLTGAMLTILARSVRRLIERTVRLEAENFEIQSQQAELIFEGKMASISRLVAGVAHEINSPLGVLKSSAASARTSARRIEEAVQGAEALDALKADRRLVRSMRALEDGGSAAEQAAERIMRLILALKRFAQLDEAEVQRFDLRESIQSVMELVDERIRGSVDVELQLDELPLLQGRLRSLNQVFLTIITNAFEAARARVQISAFEEAGRVIVEIEDDGPGVPEASRERLFDLSFGSKKARVGFGLGLPTARRIVHQHGGQLSLVSEVGSGARFRIELPLLPQEEAQ